MPRLIIISNRLPVTIDQRQGELYLHPSAGGLATGLRSLEHQEDTLWIGWPGGETYSKKNKNRLVVKFEKDNLIPVYLTKKEISRYYEGFSNKVIWPHFHYFAQYTSYREEYWKAYKKVNLKFANIAIQHIQHGDRIWIHDYQLMLLPAIIRKAFPEISIGFFLHIPFPSYEIFRLLPWRKDILKGLLGADQIGFHTFGYMRHFLSAAYRITGYEHHFGKLTVGKRLINVDVFPMGIDYEKYAFPEQSAEYGESQIDIQRILAKKRKLILSIDRLDYTKGIPHRLKAFEKFIDKYPEFKGKVTLMLIVVPSRSNVNQYQKLKEEVDTLVGRIDGKYRTFGWSPIQYFYRSFSFTDLCLLYKIADIAMITPLRDGMNLVAKEFVASKETDKEGVLILSEFAGASAELTDAIIVNPRDSKDMVKAMIRAMKMPLSEQKKRLTKMQARLKKHTVENWAKSFLSEQSKLQKKQISDATNLITGQLTKTIVAQYQVAKKKLLLLDYDGTLVNFQDDPSDAAPDKDLIKLLKQLNTISGNTIVIISGRDKTTLENWLGVLNLEMSAEHGVWRKMTGEWQLAVGLEKSWKNEIRPVLENLVERTPGSFIEEKDYSLTWHYRTIDKDLSAKRIREYRDDLQYLTSNLNVQLLEGNKVVEIKNTSINKGMSANKWLQHTNWDFILAIGDDQTDEDTFRALPKYAFTVKVGLSKTVAKYNLLSVENVRELLNQLVNADAQG